MLFVYLYYQFTIIIAIMQALCVSEQHQRTDKNREKENTNSYAQSKKTRQHVT